MLKWCRFSIVIWTTICCVDVLSHLVPKILLKKSKILCSPPPMDFDSNATRWLIQGQYSRSFDYINLTELADEDTIMCQHESCSGELTGWSEPVQLHKMDHPVLATLSTQRVFASSPNDLVTFSCGIQIDDAGKKDIRLSLINSSSCQDDQNFLLRNRSEAEIFVQNLSVNVDLSAFRLHNERLAIKCWIRPSGANIPILTCNEIVLKDEPPSATPTGVSDEPPSATSTGVSSSCPMEDHEKKSTFSLHFLGTRCEQHELETELRRNLMQNQCLGDGNFIIRVSCGNESSGQLVLFSSRKISEQTLSTALSDVEVVEISSTPTPGGDSTFSEMTCCTPTYIPIVISTVVGILLFLLSVVVHLGLCFGKRRCRHRTQPSHMHQASPVGECKPGVPQSPSQQVSVEGEHNSMMITDPLPMTTSAPVEAEAGMVESSVQVTPPPTAHAGLIRRQTIPRSSIRCGAFIPEQAILHTSPLQQFTHRGGTPGPSAGVSGETLLPGTTDDSIGMAGEYVAHHEEQSAHQHRQAASHLNETQSGLAGNHRYLGIAPQYYLPQLDKNSTIAHHQPYPAVPLLYLSNATYLCEAAPGAVPMYVPMCHMVPQQDPPAPVDDNS